MATKKIIQRSIILSIIAILLAFIVNTISPNGIALVGQWNTSKGVISAKSKDDFVISSREIEFDDAKKLYKRGWLFVDARPKYSYKEGHIKGAVSLSIENVFASIPDFVQKYNPSTKIVTYCSGRECPDSHEIADALEASGYLNVKVYIDGYPEWKNKGMPIAK